MRKGIIRFLAAIAIVAVILVIGVYTLTNTDWGRDQVRKRVLAALQGNVHGIVRVGKVTGNLLKGFTLHDIVITDSANAPFFKADEARARYALRSLSGKRIEFDDVTLVRPIFVLDRPPGGKWNWDRIFPRDTATPRGPRKSGWGTWIRFTDVTLIDGDVTVRSPWEPAPNTGADKSDVIREALGPEGRLALIEVPNGYQKVSKFHKLNAKLPLLRLEDPGFKTRRADIASLSMIAEPFRPPLADVRSLVGGLDFTGDSVWWQNMKVSLPNSRLTGSGRYTIANNDLTLRMHADPVAAADIRWVYPRLPEKGSGTLDFAMDWVGDTSIYIGRNADVRIADAHLVGDIGITVAEQFSIHNTNLRFTSLDTKLIQQIFPAVKPPRSGILSGRAKLDGNQQNLAVDGDVTFIDRKAGRNRVIAVGEVGFAKGEFRADNLRLTMRPVQVDLAREMSPTLPIHGTITGTATLNGSTRSRMTARADITHVDRGAVSRMTGTAAFRGPPGKMASSWFDVDAQLHPLSLVTAGRFFPKAGLRGTATGPMRLTGTMRDLFVKTNLGFNDGGSLGLTGKLDLASRDKGYDVDIVTQLFNANTIIAKAPRTSITATASAEGRGFDPATMRANLVADVQSSSYDTLSVNAATIRVAAADGMARIDTLAIEIPQGIANASGTFGLAKGRSGSLKYHVDVDSLNKLASLFPPVQPGSVPPRPGILAERLARARADSARIAQATEVERAATGRGTEPTLAPVDTPRTLSMSELSGSLQADGVATGNIKDFGLKGTASGTNIVARGNSVQTFTATYDWTNALTPQSHVDINASGKRVAVAGFDLDSVQTRITYRKPQGTAELTVVQNAKDVYSINADYMLNKVRNELRLNRMQLRFDTTVWASTGPSLIHWGSAGVDIDKLEVRNQKNGRIFVDGLIPKEGRANLELAVDNFAVEDLIALAQSDVNARGLVSFDMKAQGTAADPTFSGSFGTQNFFYNGTLIPEVHGTLSYANQTLRGRADAMREGGRSLFFAEGSIPINLAFTGVTGSRLPRDRQVDVAIRADSLPLNLLPQFPQYVTNVKGRAVADFKVNGTLNNPEVTGRMNLDSGEAKVVPLGITLKKMSFAVKMLRDTIVIDSAVAWSGGRIALTGGLGIGSLRTPSFDLNLAANNAVLLLNRKGYLKSNINLSINGPFTDTHVGGGVRLLDGVLYIPKSEGKKVIGARDPALFNVLDTAVVANREIFPAQSPLLANLRMDVDLRVDRDVFVRSQDYNIEVYSDGDLAVHVNRAKESLVLDGILLSERGEYRFLSKRFQVNRGSATFVNLDEINPTLQVSGGYEVRLPGREAFNIQILVGGTLRNPQISLESDAQPPITQSDLLSYLAFGRSSSSLLQLEGSGFSSSNNLVGAGAALASKQLAAVALGVMTDQLSGEAARSIGVDVFSIAPADVQTDVGSFLRGTEIDVGKYIKSHTYVAGQLRPDPAALRRPGLLLEHRFGGLRGYSLETSFQPRYLLQEPSLGLQAPNTTSVFSLFLIRNWRF